MVTKEAIIKDICLRFIVILIFKENLIVGEKKRLRKGGQREERLKMLEREREEINGPEFQRE